MRVCVSVLVVTRSEQAGRWVGGLNAAYSKCDCDCDCEDDFALTAVIQRIKRLAHVAMTMCIHISGEYCRCSLCLHATKVGLPSSSSFSTCSSSTARICKLCSICLYVCVCILHLESAQRGAFSWLLWKLYKDDCEDDNDVCHHVKHSTVPPSPCRICSCIRYTHDAEEQINTHIHILYLFLCPVSAEILVICKTCPGSACAGV